VRVWMCVWMCVWVCVRSRVGSTGLVMGGCGGEGVKGGLQVGVWWLLVVVV